MELTLDQELEKFMNAAANDKTKLGVRKLNEFLEGPKKGMKKDQIKPGTVGKRLYALELALPINPFDTTDDSYNKANPFLMPYAPTTTAMIVKKLANENEVVKAAYAKYAGIDPADWDTTTTEKLTETDIKIFRPFRQILHYSMKVQQFKFSAFGEYGRKFLSTATFDDYGRVVTPDLGTHLSAFYMSIANQELEVLDKNVKTPGHALYGISEKALKEERGKVFNRMLVSNPYNLGILRCLTLEVDEDGKPIAAETDILSDLTAYEFYSGGSKKVVEELNLKLNSKHDKNFDYLEVDITYPDAGGDNDSQKKFNSYGLRQLDEKYEYPIRTMEGFDEAYIAFRNNQERYCDQFLIEQIYDYNIIEADKLLEYAKAHIVNHAALLSEANKTTHAALIEQCTTGATLSDVKELVDSIDEIKIVDPEYKPTTENTPGAGVDADLQIAAVDLGLEDE